MSVKVMGTALRADEGATTGQQGSPLVARKGPKRADERAPTAEEMAKIAKLFDAVVSAWGGSDAAAHFLEIDKSNVSRMRSGEKSVAFRHFVALFEGCPDAFLAFARPICADLGLAPPLRRAVVTRAEIAADFLTWGRGESLAWRVYLASARERLGWTEEDIADGLENK